MVRSVQVCDLSRPALVRDGTSRDQRRSKKSGAEYQDSFARVQHVEIVGCGLGKQVVRLLWPYRFVRWLCIPAGDVEAGLPAKV